VALIVSPGRTGKFATAPTCVDRLLVTFCPASTDISTWTSRKPRPKNVWKRFDSPLGAGLYARFGTVHRPEAIVIGAAAKSSS